MKRSKIPLHISIIIILLQFCAPGLKTGSSIEPIDNTTINSELPVPGQYMISRAIGSTVETAWGEASDNGGKDNLKYKVVKSDSPIIDPEKADLLPKVIQNYEEYENHASYEYGVEPGTHYYNVIVKDKEGNKSLYEGQEVMVYEDTEKPRVDDIIITVIGMGSTIKVIWIEATDNSLKTGLTYRLVRSETDILTVSDAEAAVIVQDYTPYVDEWVYDTGLSTGVYYYNVIVKDAAGNKSIYKSEFAHAEADTTPPTPGEGVTLSLDKYEVTITWEEALDDSLSENLTYRIVRSPAEITTLAEADSSDVVMHYSFFEGGIFIDENFLPGIHYYNVIVKDGAGNRNLYQDDWVDISDSGYNISGTVTLPDATTEDVAVYIDYDNDMSNGCLQEVSAVYEGGLVYTYVFEGIYNGSYYVYVVVDNDPYGMPPEKGDYIGYYHGTGMEPPSIPYLNVDFGDKDGIDIYPVEHPGPVYTVSGIMAVPVIINDGLFITAIDVDGSNDTINDRFTAYGDWSAGCDEMLYSIEGVPVGSYYIISTVLNVEGPVQYVYQSSEPEVTVIDTDVTDADFILNEL